MLLKLTNEINIELKDINEHKDTDNCVHLECILKDSDHINYGILEKKYPVIYVDDKQYENVILYSIITKNGSIVLCFTNNHTWYDSELTVSELFELHNDLSNLIEMLNTKQIPEKNNENLQKLTYKTPESVQVNKLAGYTMLSKDWVDDFANWIGNRKVLEVGAGVGALAKELQDRKVDITAIDDRSWDRFSWEFKENSLWTDVIKENYLTNAIKYRDIDLLILSYPVQGEFAGIALELMRIFSPNCNMVFIGPFRDDYVDEKFISSANIISDDEVFNNLSNKYKYWIGQPYMKSQLLYLK